MGISWISEYTFVGAQKRVDVRLIVVAQPFLFLNSVALIVEILLGYFERPHPVTFEPKGEWKMTGRKGLEIVGSFGRSSAVHGSAGIEDVLEVAGLWDVFRPLKHHVFEEVGKPRPAWFFVTRANVVVKRDGYDWDSMVFAKYDAKTVIESLLFDWCW